MKILIADDEKVSKLKVQKLLAELGHETLVASDGLEAWRIWKQQRPRMLITDWLMPGMDGLELCRAIRENEGSQYTYVIMITAMSNTSDIITGMEAGADDFLTKPFVKEELAVRVKAGERILGIETRDMVIFALANLAESRDSETGQHLERIRYYSRLLSETLAKKCLPDYEIDQRFISNIFLTSPLHDIGKVGIPDNILLKPGKLTEEEFEVMKGHCLIGYNTLNAALQRYPKADFLEMSAQIALSHHEKWDGNGYPQGLKGKDIPLAARIVALADVFDALVNKRVYKEAFGLENSRDIILAGRGTHFDPVIIEAFESCVDEFIEIFNRFREDGNT